MLGLRGILGIQLETYIQVYASSSEKYSQSYKLEEVTISCYLKP